MAVLPSFTPAQPPDTVARLIRQGQDDSQSWMNQAASRDSVQAQTEASRQNTELIRMKMPAIMAKAESDRVSAETDISAATLMQRLRGEFQSLKPAVVADIAAVEDPNNQAATEDGQPDWEDKYHQYEQLQAKYGQLKLFPEGKAYYDLIDKAKKDAFDMASRHATAQSHLDAIKAAGEAGLGRTELNVAGRENVAKISAGARGEVAKTNAAAKVGAAEINTGASMERTEYNGFNRAAADYENLAMKETDPKKSAAYIERANQLRDKAQAVAHPPVEAASPEITVDIPGNTPATGDAEDADLPEEAGGAAAPAAAPAPVAQPAAAAPAAKPAHVVAPTKVAKGATSVNVGGKPQKLFKDAKGKLAYKLNGTWIEVQEE